LIRALGAVLSGARQIARYYRDSSNVHHGRSLKLQNQRLIFGVIFSLLRQELHEEWRARNSKAAQVLGPTELSSSENWKLLFTHASFHRFTCFSSFCRFSLPFLVAVLQPKLFHGIVVMSDE
jgi:hypothetical protein